MNYEEFIEIYNPQTNELCPDAPFDGMMYETFGDEVEYIKDLIRGGHNKRIWTYVDADGSSLILAGYHFVNRLGYFVTEKEWENDYDYVDLGEDEDD